VGRVAVFAPHPLLSIAVERRVAGPVDGLERRRAAAERLLGAGAGAVVGTPWQ